MTSQNFELAFSLPANFSTYFWSSFKKLISTGSSNKLVRMITATPILAVIANSRIMPISITNNVIKPTVSDNSAIPPGTSKFLNAAIDARLAPIPVTACFSTALIICTPWLTPMANTKNGTSIDIGSIPKPIEVSSPSCQITAMIEHTNGNNVSMMLREKKYTITAVIAIAMAKKINTSFAPSATSPIIFAKPII